MSQRESKGKLWNPRLRLRRRRHRLKKENNETPETGRRSVKQVLREYRNRHSAGSSRNGGRSTRKFSCKLMDSEDPNLAHSKNCSSPVDAPKVYYKQPLVPAIDRELTYREEPSTESFVMRNLPLERSVVNSHFEPLKTHVTKTKSAPECVSGGKSSNGASRPFHEPLPLNFKASVKTEFLQDSVRASSINNTSNHNQHFAPRSDAATISVAEPLINSTASDRQVVPVINGNGVMKKIESSILSFFGIGSTKESSMRHTNKSQSSTEPTSDRIMSFFSYKGTNGTNKWNSPTNAATEEIDYSIYGNHAKYYM